MNSATPSPRLPVLALLGSSLLWGCNWIPLKHFAAAGIAGAALMLIAYGPVTLFALPLLARERRLLLDHWRAIAGIFLLGGFANIAFNLALMYGDVVRSMSLFYTLPLWAILGGMVFLGERLTPLRVIAAACALSGAWLILGGVNLLDAPPTWLDSLAIASGFAYAMNNVIFRATPALPVMPRIIVMYFGCALMAALVVVAGVQKWPAQPDAGELLLAGAFGACWLMLANLGTQWGVIHMEAGRAAMIIVLELVVTVLTAMWLGGTQLSAIEWAGAALLVSGALLEARGGTAERSH